MPNSSEPDREDTPEAEHTADDEHQETGKSPEAGENPETGKIPAAGKTPEAGEQTPAPDDEVTDNQSAAPAEAEPATEALEAGGATEVLTTAENDDPPTTQTETPGRRFTAPGFDAGSTEALDSFPEPETESFEARGQGSNKATPQLIPSQLASKLPSTATRGWGWVLALLIVIVVLTTIAVAGTVWLTRSHRSPVSQEDQVRTMINEYDTAVQSGDLTTLRTITCGAVNDGYLNLNDEAWSDTYRRITAAKRYPVVSSIDQVVINGDHAEANVTAFMAHAPQIRSTRSFDLQFRDDQWKICQSTTG